MDTLRIILLDDIEDFILSLPIKDQYKISSALDALRNRKFDTVYIKQLRGNLKELKVRKYRLIFFIHKNEIYFLRVFIKKSDKTPKREIDLAEKFYKQLNNN